MLEANAESIQEVFCEVLESLAFMFGDPADKEGLATDEPVLEATVEFRGPSQGGLTILTPHSVAGEVAANLLGVDPDDESAAEQAHDALGELMNVTLGRLLTTLAGAGPVFDLSPPKVSDADGEKWNQFMEAPQTVAFLIDDRPVLLRFSSESSRIAQVGARSGDES